MKYMRTIPKYCLPLMLGVGSALAAPISITTTQVYTENFDSLGTADVPWADDSTLAGWLAEINDGTTASGNAQAADGTTVLSGLLNLGAAADGDRSLGSKATGTGNFANIAYGVLFKNDSAKAIRVTEVKYAGELWRTNTTAAGLAETFTVFYQVSNSPITDVISGPSSATAAAGTGFTALGAGANWASPTNLPAASALDGNLAANRLVKTFDSSAVIPPLLPGQYLMIKWTDTNLGRTDGFQGIDDVSISFQELPCVINPTVTNVTRNLNGTPGDATDDRIDFSLSATAIGAPSGSWIVSGPAGSAVLGVTAAYGATVNVTNVPIAEFTPSSILTLIVADSVDGTCSGSLNVTAPLTDVYVTSANSAQITFTQPAAGAQSYTRTEGGDLGWSGGAANAIVRIQPTTTAGLEVAKYFGFNDDTATPAFVTERVNASLVSDVLASVDLSAYTTSTTGFEGPDAFSVIVEGSVTGDFTDATEIGRLLDETTVDGVALFADVGVGINFGTGAGQTAFPDTAFPFKTKTIAFSTAGHPWIRFKVTGDSDSGSEFFLVDNFKFSTPVCDITAVASNAVRQNVGNDDNPANDTFTFDVTVTAQFQGASTGWTSDGAVASGNYSAVAITAYGGVHPVTGGAITINFFDGLDPNCTEQLVINVPACILTPVVTNVARDEKGTPTLVDDTLEFDLTVNAVNASTGWTSNLPVPGAPGTFYSGDYGTLVHISISVSAIPATMTVLDKGDANCTANLTAALPEPLSFVVADFDDGVNPISLVTSASATAWTNPANLDVRLNGTAGNVTTNLLDLSSVAEVDFDADLVVIETSTGSNFETRDTFTAELTYYIGGTSVQTVNLILPYDKNASGTMNGNDADETLDEFNPDAIPEAQTFTKTLHLEATIPANVEQVTLGFTGDLDSGSENLRFENAHFVAVSGPVDTDGDGLEDSWEITFFGDLSKSGTDDTDGDGMTNAQEQAAGTDPTDSTSALKIVSFSKSGNSFNVGWTSQTGKTYQVQISPDLTTAWTNLGATITGNPDVNGVQTVTQDALGVLPDKYFLRVVIP